MVREVNATQVAPEDKLNPIINQFDENGLTVVIGDYLGCLNRTKTFSVAGTSYLIGTVDIAGTRVPKKK